MRDEYVTRHPKVNLVEKVLSAIIKSIKSNLILLAKFEREEK